MTDLVRLERVTCAYGDERVLIDIDATIRAGAFIGVVGPSGSGKSTLLKAITGTIKPVSGRLLRPSGPVTIGYVPQVETVNWFFPVTVLDVVLMAAIGRRVPWAGRDQRRRAAETLARLGLDGYAGRHIRELSGGQQQRVFIARALFARPQLLLLDEPTGGVDVHTRHDVMHVLHDLHHDGLAIVLTTHDLNGVAAHLPELVCLNRTVIATGTPAQVMRPDVLERTYGAPMEVLSHGGMPVVVETLPPDELVERPGHHEHSL